MPLREDPARTSHHAAANRVDDLKYGLKSTGLVLVSFASPVGNAVIPAHQGREIRLCSEPGTLPAGAESDRRQISDRCCSGGAEAPPFSDPPRFCRLQGTWRMIVFVRHNSAHTARSPVANSEQSSLCKSTYIAKSTPKMQWGAPLQSWNVMWNHEDGGILGKSPLRGAPVFTKFEFFEFCIPLIPRALRKHLADTAQPTIEKTRENAPTLTSTGQNAFYLESITYAGERARTKAGMFFRVSKSRLNDKPTFTKRPKRECGLESAT